MKTKRATQPHPRACMTPKARTRIQQFILALTNLHHEAHACGMNATGHAMHEAVRKAGWEFAELCTKQDARERRRRIPGSAILSGRTA